MDTTSNFSGYAVEATPDVEYVLQRNGYQRNTERSVEDAQGWFLIEQGQYTRTANKPDAYMMAYLHSDGKLHGRPEANDRLENEKALILTMIQDEVNVKMSDKTHAAADTCAALIAPFHR